MTDSRVRKAEQIHKATQAILNLPGTWPDKENAKFLARAILAVIEVTQEGDEAGAGSVPVEYVTQPMSEEEKQAIQDKLDAIVEVQPLTVEGKTSG